jgi:ATP-dependent RNA helicase RhlE
MQKTFEDLQLIPQLQRAVRDEGYQHPTAIQVSAIPHVLAGRDLLGLAQTGTGKTAAFALPILQRLVASGRRPSGDRPIAVLVLTPTRELASQIGESFAQYGKHLGFRHTVVFGGVGQTPQERALRAGVDILVATPGRLLDLAQQRVVHLQKIEIFVLDEADRMLDMGFVHDVRRVVALLPAKRQTLFFSATMPPEAKRLADSLLRHPETVAVTPVASTVDAVEQLVYFAEKSDKRALLQRVLEDRHITRVLVFTRTKHMANRVAEYLARVGVQADAIHGNKSQGARERALARFKRGESRVLVATDIAARGIDIDDVSHVVNFDLPNVPETYVHRIGRTARAGASGVAISFCDHEERAYLNDIERLIRRTIKRVESAQPREPEPRAAAPAQHAPKHPPAQHAPRHPPAQHAPKHPPAHHAPKHPPAHHAPKHPPAQHAPKHPPAHHAPKPPPAHHAPKHPPAPHKPHATPATQKPHATPAAQKPHDPTRPRGRSFRPRRPRY